MVVKSDNISEPAPDDADVKTTEIVVEMGVTIDHPEKT
jgi:hypothetical protein